MACSNVKHYKNHKPYMKTPCSISTCFDYSIPVEKQLPMIADAGFTHVSLGLKPWHFDYTDAAERRRLKKLLTQKRAGNRYFRGDEEGEVSTPERIAKYNGIAQVLRPTSIFEVLPLDTISQAPTFGAHASSWARFEGGQLVLLAWRPPVPGEENPLAQSSLDDPRVKDAVRSLVPVVVASKTGESIGAAANWPLRPTAAGRFQFSARRASRRDREPLFRGYGDAGPGGHRERPAQRDRAGAQRRGNAARVD